MVYNREEAVRRALAAHTNIPDFCQGWTRDIFGVPSVGDYDGDGAADAEDGWTSEPRKYKHPGDRTPPAGVPVSYGGGSHDNGHRAVSLGHGMIRSTDAGGRGVIATVPLDWPERVWGLKYLGWSDSCDGVLIPEAPKPQKDKPKHHGPSEMELERAAEKAVFKAQHKVAENTPKGKPHRTRWTRLHRALNILKKIRKSK